MLTNPALGRPNIDISGTYYGAFPTAPMGYEDMVSPTSAKRSRDGFDEILSDTLGSFAMEAKKKRLDPSYNEGNDCDGKQENCARRLKIGAIFTVRCNAHTLKLYLTTRNKHSWCVT